MVNDDLRELHIFEIALLDSKYGPIEESKEDESRREPLSERTITEKDESEKKGEDSQPLPDDPITPEIRAQID